VPLDPALKNGVCGERSDQIHEFLVSMKELRENVGLIAYKNIKRKILQNELDFRQGLKEVDFSRELGLSRTPVREAFIMLEREGLLARSLGKGFYVQNFSMKDIYDFYQFRHILETASANYIIANVTDKDVDELSNFLQKVDIMIHKGRTGEALAAGLEFHVKIIEICQNELIINSLRNCYEKLTLVSYSVHQLDASYKSAEEHRKILSALRSRDLGKLQEDINEHIVNARDRTLKMFNEHKTKLYFHP
jgi:DNA-binding GntR family transcriptional regulator